MPRADEAKRFLTPFSSPVCEKGHGCAPVPLDDQKIAELQAADPRCPTK
jgi:hypothetical protein